MSREADLLDALEDAREDHDRDRRQLTFGLWLGFGSLVAILGTAVGMMLAHWAGFDLGMLGLAHLLYVATLITGGVITGDTWFEDLPRSRKALKKAQRAHRNHTLNS